MEGPEQKRVQADQKRRGPDQREGFVLKSLPFTNFYPRTRKTSSIFFLWERMP